MYYYPLSHWSTEHAISRFCAEYDLPNISIHQFYTLTEVSRILHISTKALLKSIKVNQDNIPVLILPTTEALFHSNTLALLISKRMKNLIKQETNYLRTLRLSEKS